MMFVSAVNTVYKCCMYCSGGTVSGWRILAMKRCSCVNVTGVYSVSQEHWKQYVVAASLARCGTCSFNQSVVVANVVVLHSSQNINRNISVPLVSVSSLLSYPQKPPALHQIAVKGITFWCFFWASLSVPQQVIARRELSSKWTVIYRVGHKTIHCHFFPPLCHAFSSFIIPWVLSQCLLHRAANTVTDRWQNLQ